MDPRNAQSASIYFPAITPDRKKSRTPRWEPVQYWTPPGHNTWVGDVVTFFHRGRYHVFYLFDRRHHQSKFGCGAHYFEHLSTTDFRTWTEHEAATPLDEQWECIGTGTPFVFGGKLCLSYGLHTGRVFSDDETMWPAQWEHLSKTGRTGAFPRATAPGAPAGATYAVSEDGVSHFRKTWLVFHPCQNPSVYTDPGGKLRMLANAGSKGIWESDSIDGGWRCVRSDFPPGGDCTFFFRWGKWDYILGGFKDMWFKPADAPDTSYEDMVARGMDCYDGLAVPAVTEISGGRFLMAGWVGVRGWGGVLCIRELVQETDGGLGTKWMPEVTPAAAPPTSLAASVTGDAEFAADSEPYMLTFRVVPKEPRKGKLTVSFRPADSTGSGHSLSVDLAAGRADFGRPIKTLSGIDRPFVIRVVVKGSDKLGGAVLDVEIAGARTAIVFREDLRVARMRFHAEEVEIRDITVARLRVG